MEASGHADRGASSLQQAVLPLMRRWALERQRCLAVAAHCLSGQEAEGLLALRRDAVVAGIAIQGVAKGDGDATGDAGRGWRGAGRGEFGMEQDDGK